MEKNLLKKIIPSYIGTGQVLFGYSVLSMMPGKVPGFISRDHLKRNTEVWKALSPGEGEYIENQHELSKMCFGTAPKSDIAYSGCEVIGVYNLLLSLGERPSFPELIYDFERDGIALKGGFGVSPRAMYSFLKRKYLSAEVFTPSIFEKEDALAENLQDFQNRHRAVLITVFNDKENIMSMVHTMCVEKREEKYVLHNKGNGTESPLYESLFRAVKNSAKNPRLLQIIGI